MPDGSDRPAGTLFLLGVPADPRGTPLTGPATIHVASLQDEARLVAAGLPARYVYRDRDAIFARAETLALDWLATLEARATAVGGSASILFGEHDGCAPWPLSYDALFEIKAGIFDSIFHALLADELFRTSTGPVRIVATRGDQLALALARLPGWDAGLEWVEPAPPAADQPPSASRVARLWQRADRLLIHPLLVGLRRLREGRRPASVDAIVGPGGEMAKVVADARGRLQVEDVYYENLEAPLRDHWPGLLKVCINPPKIPHGGWRATLTVWRLILAGSFRPWYAYAGWADILATLRARRRYARVVAAGDRDAGFAGLFRAGGVDFHALLRPRLLEMLPGMLAAAHFHARVAERFVRRENVGRVLSVESFSNLGRCLAAALHRHGGCLWGIQGGIISPRRVTNIGFFAAALGGRRELLADAFFAWGPAYRQVLESFGLPAERIHVMGFNRAKPRADAAPPRRGTRRVVYIAGGNALVCPYLMTLDEDLHTLRVLAASLPADTELLVRIHPRHRAEDFRAATAGLPGVRLLGDGEMSLAACLAGANCIVGKASTVLLEAAHAGHPVLVVNLAGTPEFTGFTAGRAALPYATDPAGLRQRLAQLLSDPAGARTALRSFADAWCADDAGVAIERILGAAPAPRPAPVLFVCSSALHVRLFAAVIRVLAGHGVPPLILSLDRFHAGVHGTAADCARALRLPAEIIDADFQPAAGQSVLQRVIATQLHARRGLVRLIGERRTALVVVGNDTGHAERAVVHAARAAGCPSMLVQDGYLFEHFPPTLRGRLLRRLRQLWLAAGGDRLGGVPYGMGGCDFIAAYGEAWAGLFAQTRRGRTRAIEVTGHPALCIHPARGWQTGDGRDIVYFCTNFLSALDDRDAHRRQIDEIRSLRQLLNAHAGPGTTLRVRLHPGDKPDDYAALAGIPGIELQHDTDLATTIRSAWLGITNISSVALNCLAEGRICLISPTSVQSPRYARNLTRLPGPRLASHADLPHWLQRLDSPPRYQAALDAAIDELQPWFDAIATDTGARRLADFIGRSARRPPHATSP